MIDVDDLRRKKETWGTLSWASEGDEILHALVVLDEWALKLESYLRGTDALGHRQDACRYCIDKKVLETIRYALGRSG